MMKIKTLIVDDEPLVRERIHCLLAHDEEIELLEDCTHGLSAVVSITQNQPELLFLDVQMPEFDGFAVVEKIGVGRVPIIIFVTAYENHALRAFEVQAFDYILKPIDGERFLKTLNRAKTQVKLRRETNADERLNNLLGTLSDERANLQKIIAEKSVSVERLMIQSGGRITFLAVDEIDWIESAGNYLELHTGKKSHLLRETMNGIETKLDSKRFLRIQRSTIVNIERIKELHPLFRGAFEVILHDGTRLTTTRGYHEKLLNLFVR